MPPILRVILFGASGMVGAAVLDTALAHPDVEAVLCVGRRPSGRSHPKLRDLVLEPLEDLSPVAGQLKGHNACFFTVGASALGRGEEAYTQVNQALPLAVADQLLALNPDLAFVYVSGAGADASERGRVMWARVKGRTENELLKKPFRCATMVRLAGLIPLKGAKSRTPLYQFFYVLLGPALPLLARLFPNAVTTPAILGRAFIRAAQGLAPKPRLEPQDIHALGREP